MTNTAVINSNRFKRASSTLLSCPKLHSRIWALCEKCCRILSVFSSPSHSFTRENGESRQTVPIECRTVKLQEIQYLMSGSSPPFSSAHLSFPSHIQTHQRHQMTLVCWSTHTYKDSSPGLQAFGSTSVSAGQSICVSTQPPCVNSFWLPMRLHQAASPPLFFFHPSN